MKIWVGMRYRFMSCEPIEYFTKKEKADEWLSFVQKINDHEESNGDVFGILESEADSWFLGKNEIITIHSCEIHKEDGVLSEPTYEEEYYLSDDKFLDMYELKPEGEHVVYADMKENDDCTIYIRHRDRAVVDRIVNSLQESFK